MEQIVKMVLCLLLLLAVQAYCQQTVPLCPEIPISELDGPSPFTCTTLIGQTWTGSAFTDQCPDVMPVPDVIVLDANTLSTGTCGAFTGTVTSVNGNDVTGSLSFTPTQDMDGLGIECEGGTGNIDSNFTIEISDNLIITAVEDSPTMYGCVTATLQAPADTTGISNYKVEAILDGSVFTESASDDANDLEVEICGLNLCDDSYMFRAVANGGNICPSELTSATLSLSALGRVSNVRRSGADSIEWDRPSGAPGDCSISYIISVTGGPDGDITSSTTSTVISLSDIDEDLDTCNSNLRITVVAEVPSIGAVANSTSDPPFNPTIAFPPNADGVSIVDPPTYAITGGSTVIQIMTAIGDEVLQLFPDGFINVSYSGSGCGGSSQVMNDVAQVDIGCLGETNVGFTAELVDDPDCRSSSSNLSPQSFPLISEPNFQLNIRNGSDSVTVSFPEFDNIRVEDGSFDVVGTATPVNGGDSVSSGSATFPNNAVFRNLEPITSYNFVIRIVSQASDGVMIGSFSGTFTTSTASQSNIGAIVGGVVGGIAALVLVLVVVVLVYLFCCRDKSKGPGKKRPDQQELRERTTSADAPPDVETAPTYADPNTIQRQEFPGTHDVYTVVDSKKKTPKPDDQLPTYQAPESIKREAAPTTGELYTVPEGKKGSKKKKEAPLPEYSQVDLQKKHQPPSGLMYSELNLPPAGKTPDPKTVEYTDIRPQS